MTERPHLTGEDLAKITPFNEPADERNPGSFQTDEIGQMVHVIDPVHKTFGQGPLDTPEDEEGAVYAGTSAPENAPIELPSDWEKGEDESEENRCIRKTKEDLEIIESRLAEKESVRKTAESEIADLERTKARLTAALEWEA